MWIISREVRTESDIFANSVFSPLQGLKKGGGKKKKKKAEKEKSRKKK